MRGMTDMAISPKENEVLASPLMEGNKYPYGLQICLTQDELEKLGVDHSDWEVGATFELNAFAKVTSISENEMEGGEKTCSVRLQITHLAGEEAEDEEEEAGDLRKHGYLEYED
jgi:hypothetical protein